ncbi:MAG TPA: SDR family oxidoreductase [Opitutaceae bacterium]|nr:SDR family oxidoreductase [Opitutaceae bacterium]
MSAQHRAPVVVVTGASQGIGAAIARAFSAEVPGVRLALVARSRRNLAAVARECARLGARPEAFPCDVSDEAAVGEMERAVRRRLGEVDVLVNNAGKYFGAPFLATSAGDFDRTLAANLRSLFLVTKAFAPRMVRRRRGDIFNMGSVAGLAAYPGGSAYTAAKFGVAGLSKAMRAEFKDKGVRVCCVHPGATVSPSWKGSGVPARRMMPAEDVASAFIALYRMTRRTVVEEIVLRPQLGDL